MDDLGRLQGRYPENFVLISQLEVCQEGGVKKGGTRMTLRIPDRRQGGHGHSWRHEWCFFTPRKIPWKFRVDISIRSVSRRGGQEGGTLSTLRAPDRRHGGQGHPWDHEWCFLPKGRYPENFVLILQLEVCKKGGSRRGVLGGRWGFLMGDLEDRVILGNIEDLGTSQGSYSESFWSLSLFLAEI